MGPEKTVVAGGYALHLVAAGVAAGCTALRFLCRVPELVLEAEGGEAWPEDFLRQAGPELPPSRSLRHVMQGALRALHEGAAEVELRSGTQSLRLKSRVLSECPAIPGFTVRVSWPGRAGTPPEAALLAQRTRLCPVPLTVNDELVSLGLQLGDCAVAREAAGPAPVRVEARPLVFQRGADGPWAYVALGGAWFLDQGPGVRIWFVVDGLSYPLDHLELGCADLRAVVHAPEVRAQPGLDRLERDDVVAGLLHQLRQHVEAAKRELAGAFPVPGPRGPGVWSTLRLVVCEERVRGPAEAALELCRRILPEVSDPRPRDFFLEAAAGLASRLEQHELARELIEEGKAEGVALALRLDTQGVILLAAGQPQRAEETLLQAEEIKRRLLDAQEPHWVAETLERLTQVALARGAYAAAERYAKRGVARTLEGLGDGHPATAQALLGMARVYLAQDRLEEAESVVTQVLAGSARDPYQEAQALLHGAMVACLEERWGPAQEGAARARQILEGPDALGALLLEGLAWTGQERWPEAVAALTECLRGLESQLGPQHTEVAAARLALGRVRWREGELAEARQHIDLARELYARKWGEAHPAVGRALDLSARVALAAGDGARAEVEARAAVAILEPLLSARELPEGHPDSAGTVLHRWWRPLDEGGLRPPIGLPLARLGRESEELARAQAHLAKVLRSLGRPEEAEVWATRARQIRQTRARATLAREAGGVLRASPDSIAVRLELEAPGRTLEWLRLDTARGRVALAARGQTLPEKDLMLALVEPERKLLQADSALFRAPWGVGSVRFLLYAADQGSSRVSAIPYVVTVGFATGPCLRVPVRLR